MDKKFTRRNIFDKQEKTVDISKYTASLQRMKIYEEKQLQENTTEYDNQTRLKKDLHDQIIKSQEDFQTDTQLIKKTCEKSIKKMNSCLLKTGKTQPLADAQLTLSNSLNSIIQYLLVDDKEDQIKHLQFDLESQVAICEKQLINLEAQWKEMNTTSAETTLLTENYFKLKDQYENLENFIQTGVEFEMNEAKNKIKELQDSLTSINKEITEAKEKLHGQEDKNIITRNELFSSLKNYMKQVENENNKRNNEIIELKSNIEANTSQLELLNQQIKELENEISALTNEMLPKQ